MRRIYRKVVALFGVALVVTVGLFAIDDSVLVNVTKFDTAGNLRFDAFHLSTGEYLAQWTDAPDYLPISSDGRSRVIGVSRDRDMPDVRIYRAKLTRRD